MIKETSNEIELSEDDISLFTDREIQKRIADIEGSDQTTEIDLQKQDRLFEESARLIVKYQQGSASIIQRRLNIGYNRALRIMDQLEALGIVGVSAGSMPRPVLVANEDDLEKVLGRGAAEENVYRELFLPSKIEYIEKQVEEYFKKKQIEEENLLKETLRQQLLEEDRARNEKLRIKRLKEQLKAEMVAEGIITDKNETTRRESIPQDVQDKVWNRDGGKCVKCGSREKLEFDHIIPISKGGSNTYRNLQILCEKCNRQKNNSIG